MGTAGKMGPNASIKPDRLLKQAQEWLALGRCPFTLEQLQALPPSPERDLVIAESLVINKQPAEAYAFLLKLLLSDSRLKPRERDRIVSLLLEVSKSCDPELADLLSMRAGSLNSLDATLALLKAFYFGGAAGLQSGGEKAIEAKRRLKGMLRKERLLAASQYFIKFAKEFSSYTCLFDLAGDASAGGGYFLNLGGFGCVVDPGHDFLRNFYALGHTALDIDCVIVTHFHDDHYADLPAVLSLLYQAWKGEQKQIRVMLDQTTYRMFRPLIDHSEEFFKGQVLRAGAGPIRLTDTATLSLLPTIHPVFGKSTGVGLDFDLQEPGLHLVITGDTAWGNKVQRAYEKLRDQRVHLVAHVSSVYPKEAVDTLTGTPAFYSRHLCLHGLGRAIEALRPEVVIISEIGEELKDTLPLLVDLVKSVFKVECKAANRQTKQHTLAAIQPTSNPLARQSVVNVLKHHLG